MDAFDGSEAAYLRSRHLRTAAPQAAVAAWARQEAWRNSCAILPGRTLRREVPHVDRPAAAARRKVHHAQAHRDERQSERDTLLTSTLQSDRQAETAEFDAIDLALGLGRRVLGPWAATCHHMGRYGHKSRSRELEGLPVFHREHGRVPAAGFQPFAPHFERDCPRWSRRGPGWLRVLWQAKGSGIHQLSLGRAGGEGHLPHVRHMAIDSGSCAAPWLPGCASGQPQCHVLRSRHRLPFERRGVGDDTDQEVLPAGAATVASRCRGRSGSPATGYSTCASMSTASTSGTALPTSRDMADAQGDDWWLMGQPSQILCTRTCLPGVARRLRDDRQSPLRPRCARTQDLLAVSKVVRLQSYILWGSS